MLFIPRDESPNGKNLLITSNEVSGSVAIFETDYQCGQHEVQVCNNNVVRCINVHMVNNLIQNGAHYGSCSPRLAADNSQSIEAAYHTSNFSISINFDATLNGDILISLYDMQGKKIGEKSVIVENQSQVVFETQNIRNGVYLVNVSSPDFSMSKKLFIENVN